MDIELIFAAQVFNAEKSAADWRKHGIMQTTSDQVCAVYDDFWQCGIAMGYDPDELTKIANRYIEWDESDEPWPRAMRDFG